MNETLAIAKKIKSLATYCALLIEEPGRGRKQKRKLGFHRLLI
jgi:hypothetical protein